MSNHLVSTRVEESTCPRCNSAIWVGLVNGFETKVDPTPLDASAEIMLRLEGVRIYQTFGIVGSQFELQERSAWHITKGDAKAVALGKHDCKRGVSYFVDLFPKPQAKEVNF